MPSVPRPTRAQKEAPAPKTPKPEPNESTTGTPSTPDSNPTGRAPKLSPGDVKLRESVKGMYEGVGMLALGVSMSRRHEGLAKFSATLMEPAVSLIGFSETGEPVMGVSDPRTGADKIADAWMVAANRNPRIKQALQRITEGGALAEVAALHITLILPFLPGIPGLAFLAPQPAPAGSNGTHP